MNGLIELMVMQLLETETLSPIQTTRRISEHFKLNFKTGTIIKTLNSLEKRGYIKRNYQNQTRRDMYKLTIEGRNIIGYTNGSINVECAVALLPVAMQI